MKKGGFLYKLPILFSEQAKITEFETKKTELNKFGIWNGMEDTGESVYTKKTFSLITIFNEEIFKFIKAIIIAQIVENSDERKKQKQLYLDKLTELKFINHKYNEFDIDDGIFDIESLIIKDSDLNTYFRKAEKISDNYIFEILFNEQKIDAIFKKYKISDSEKDNFVTFLKSYLKEKLEIYNPEFDYDTWFSSYMPESSKKIKENSGKTFIIELTKGKKPFSKSKSLFDDNENDRMKKDVSELKSIIKNYNNYKKKEDDLNEEMSKINDYEVSTNISKIYTPSPNIEALINADISKFSIEHIREYVNIFKYLVPLNFEKNSFLSSTIKNIYNNKNVRVYKKNQMENKYFEINLRTDDVLDAHPVVREEIKLLLNDDLMIEELPQDIPFINFYNIKLTKIYPYHDINDINNSWATYGLILYKRNKLDDYLKYIMNYDAKLFNNFLSFIGEMGTNDFRFHNKASIFFPFLYSGKISFMLNLFKDDYLDYIKIDDEYYIEDIKKLMNSTTMLFILDESKYNKSKDKIEQFYKDNKIDFKGIKEKIITKLTKPENNMIISYMNFNLQYEIISEFNNEEFDADAITKFHNLRTSLNNLILYNKSKITDFLAFKLTYIIINFNLLSKEIDKKLIFAGIYGLILQYINTNYINISKIINLEQISTELSIGVLNCESYKLTFTHDYNLFASISTNYPPFLIKIHQLAEYQEATDPREPTLPARNASIPCVEIGLLNLIKFMVNIPQTTRYDWNSLPTNTDPVLKTFLSSYSDETQLDTLLSIGSNKNNIQNYYRAIHYKLTDDELESLKVQIRKFERLPIPSESDMAYINSYWRTKNIELQRESPGRYSFLCIVLSKIFGLTGRYSTEELIRNFDMFIDNNYPSNLRRVTDTLTYPNDTFEFLLKQFTRYGEKFVVPATYTYTEVRQHPYGIIKTYKMILPEKIEINMSDVHVETRYLQSTSAMNYTNIFNNMYIKYDEFITEYFTADNARHYFENNSNLSTLNLKLVKNLNTFNPTNYLLKYFIYKENILFIGDTTTTTYEINPLINPKLFRMLNKHSIMYLQINTLEENNVIKKFNFYNFHYPELITFILNNFLDRYIEVDYFIPSFFNNIIHYKYVNIDNLNKILIPTYFDKLLELPEHIQLYTYYISEPNHTTDKLNKLLINFKYIILILYTTFVISNDEESKFKFSNIGQNIIQNNYFELIAIVFLKSEVLTDIKTDMQKDIRYALLERIYEIDYKLIINYMANSLPIALANYILLYKFIKNKFDTGDIEQASNMFIAFLMYLPFKFNQINLFNNEEEITQKVITFFKLDIHKKETKLIFNESFFSNKIAQIKEDPTANNYLTYYFYFASIPVYQQNIFLFDKSVRIEISGSDDYIKIQKTLLLYKKIYENIIIYNKDYKLQLNRKNKCDTRIDKFYPYYDKLYSIIDMDIGILQMYNTTVFNDNFKSILRHTYESSNVNTVESNRKFNIRDDSSTVKWHLMNKLTQCINDVLLKDEFKDNIFNFHMLIYTLIKYELERNSEILPFMNIIRVIYKGGSSMLFLNQLFNQKIHNVNKKFFDIFTKHFSRGDIDFNIIIDKQKEFGPSSLTITKEEYDTLYININKAVTIALIKIKYFLIINNEIYYNFNSVSEKDLQKCICILKDTLTKHKSGTYENIEDLIGIVFWNKIYMAKPIAKIDMLCTITKDRFIMKPTTVTSDINNILNFNINKSDFYIGVNSEHENITITRTDMDDIIFDPSSTIISYKYLAQYQSSIYYYTNESHTYLDDDDNGISFMLHRIKINSKIIYKAKKSDSAYGIFECPIEILDVSILKYNNTENTNIETDVCEYTYKHPVYNYNNKNYKFYTYSIYGFIKDLLMNIFHHNEYPWKDIKYDKRILRLIYFILIHLIIEQPDNYVVIITKIINILNKLKIFIECKTFLYKKTTISSELAGKNQEFKKELQELNELLILDKNKLIYKFIEYLCSFAEDKEVYLSYSQEYKNLLEITLSTFNDFIESNTINKITLENTKESNLFNKYLKYKQKYIKLKKELG